MKETTLHEHNIDNDATYDHIVKYAGLFGGVQGLTMLIGILRNKIAAHFLGPSGMGLVNIYNRVIGLVSQATNLGISFSAVKHVAELSETTDTVQRDALIDTVRMWCLMTAGLGMLVGLTLSPWISWWTFKNFDFTMAICSLSLVVAMMAVTGGEIAILKGLKHLKKAALISVFAALATLIVCVPFYYLWGISGVVDALLVSNAAVLGIHLYYSSRVAPWRRTIVSIRSVSAGIPMAKLGIAYVFAGILGQGAEYFIATFIQNSGGLEWVGLYGTGYFLAVSIGSMLFMSVEADFFPRLSALADDVRRMNNTVNRQIEVCVLLIAPCLIMEVMAMPIIVRLLYTAEIVQAGPMAICAIFYLFFKALTLPVAYLALAKGHSMTYLVAELLYDVFVAVAIPVAFSKYGLLGAGCALSLAGLFDMVLIYIYYGAKYKFRLTMRPVWIYLLQFALLGASVYASFLPSSPVRWAAQLCALGISAWISYRMLSRESDIVNKIVSKVKRKLGKP